MSGYSRILAALVHPPATAHTEFVMLRLYKTFLDESGINDGSKIVVVAGIALTKIRMDSFDKRWRAVIRAAGVTEFKASKFFQHNPKGERVGEYRGWSDAKAEQFLEALVRVIMGTNPVRIGTAMVVDDFFSLSDRARRYLTGAKYNPWTDKLKTSGAPKTPFHVPMQAVVIAAAQKNPFRSRVHFVCDEQEQYAGYVLERFRDMRRVHPTLRLGDLVHSESHRVPALQAADLFCYLLSVQAQLRLATGRTNPIPLIQLLAGDEKRYRFDYWDKTVLEELFLGCAPKAKARHV